MPISINFLFYCSSLLNRGLMVQMALSLSLSLSFLLSNVISVPDPNTSPLLLSHTPLTLRTCLIQPDAPLVLMTHYLLLYIPTCTFEILHCHPPPPCLLNESCRFVPKNCSCNHKDCPVLATCLPQFCHSRGHLVMPQQHNHPHPKSTIGYKYIVKEKNYPVAPPRQFNCQTKMNHCAANLGSARQRSTAIISWRFVCIQQTLKSSRALSEICHEDSESTQRET